MAARTVGWHGYDWFKLVVAIILAILLLYLWGSGPGAPAASVAPTLVAPSLTAPAAGSEVPSGPVTLRGTAAPNSEVQVVIDGQPVGTAHAGGDGTWTLDTTFGTPGSRSVVVQVLDSAGAVAAAAAPAALMVAGPQIAAPTLNLLGAPVQPGQVALTGTGAPGSRVEVLVDGQPVGTATVDADGSWSLSTDLAAGDRQVVARALDSAGAVVAATTPQVLSVAAQVPTAAAAQASTAAPAGSAPAITFPADGAAVGAGTLTLTGTGTPGERIEILDGDQVLGTVTVGADSRWSFDVTPAVGSPTYGVRPAGATGAPAGTIAVTVSGAAAAQPTAAPAATAGTLPAPGGSAGAASAARVRVVHASPDAPAVDVIVNGSKVPALTNIVYFTASDYLELPAGSYDIQVVPAGTGGPPVIDATGIQLEAGKTYTIAAGDRLSAIQPVVFEEPPIVADPRRAYLRVYHLSPDAGPVDVRVAGGPALVSGLDFPNASDYVPVDPGTYDLQVVAAGTDTVALELKGAQVTGGKVYDVFAHGLASGAPALAATVAERTPVATNLPAQLPVTGGSEPLSLLLALAAALAGVGLLLRGHGRQPAPYRRRTRDG